MTSNDIGLILSSLFLLGLIGLFAFAVYWSIVTPDSEKFPPKNPMPSDHRSNANRPLPPPPPPRNRQDCYGGSANVSRAIDKLEKLIKETR